ncbi:alpha-tocopherol transfer protein-like isoform X2 [Uloborus diversus]|nr:alpha-tocopherol transfer protein-like isoform X2 [Uloborus diversus]
METAVPSADFMPFNSTTITDDIRKTAEEELNEKESDIQSSLKTLKEYLENDADLTPCTDDGFLLKFLRARKFSVKAAWTLVQKYYSIRITYPHMFRNFNPTACAAIMQSGIHYFLPYRMKNGCAILMSRFGKWDPKVSLCEDILKFNLLCNEMAMLNPVTQITGLVTIADMKDFSWSHLFNIPISDVKCFINALENCLPVRNKAIHVVNNSSVFSVLFALVKPLLNEKVQNRIYFHGDNLDSLHQQIPPEILPEDLGGELSSLPNEDFYSSLLDMDEFFIRQQNFGYLNSNP